MNKILLAAVAWLIATPVLAAGVTPLNVTVPGSGNPFDFNFDGTNYWPLYQLWDGTTLATINPDGGLSTHIANANISATDCSVTLTLGGTAQNAFAALTTLHGFVIKNIDAVTGSGEPVWISFTGTATAGAAGSYPLAAPAATSIAGGESYSTPVGFGLNHALSVIAATTGHKISCTRW